MHVIVSRRGQHHSQISAGVGRVLTGCALAFAAVLAVLAGPAAAASRATKTVRYRGYAMRVPSSWPVFHLSRRSTVCVRFNRHALYLGAPGTRQACPATAAGRTEAILVAPHADAPAHLLAPVTAAGAQPAGGSEAQVALPAHRLEVTATWNAHPGVVKRALGGRLDVNPGTAAGVGGSHPTGTAARLTNALDFRPMAKIASAPGATGTLFTGLGFDPCTAPSSSQMTAWKASPYRAIGVYIGGTNMGCSQGNLTANWVGHEWAAGWHLMPIYVGLQAPGNSCGCAPIASSTSQAASEGTSAAIDAVMHAQAIGIGAGNPIYDDMEAYSTTSSTSAAVLAFLGAWTTELHAEGYGSGVYSSADSGIVDLAEHYGTTYQEPDDLWIARWNGAKNTSDPNVPSGDWAAGQRIHQYEGANNETFGGTTLDIDNDYLNGATAFGTPGPLPPPSLKVSSASDGTINLSASWPGGAGVTAWRTLGGSSPSTLAAIARTRSQGATTAITLHSAFPFYAVQALGASGTVLASSQTISTSPHLALYGHSVFVPARGLVGVPAGCFTGTACRLALTIKAGRRALAHTGRERLATSAGLVYFQMSSTARAMLAQRPRPPPGGHRAGARHLEHERIDEHEADPVRDQRGGPAPQRRLRRHAAAVGRLTRVRVPQRVRRGSRQLYRDRAVPDQDADHRPRQDDRQHRYREHRCQRGPLPELQAHRRRQGDARAGEGQPARRAAHAQRRWRGHARVGRAVELQLTSDS